MTTLLDVCRLPTLDKGPFAQEWSYDAFGLAFGFRSVGVDPLVSESEPRQGRAWRRDRQAEPWGLTLLLRAVDVVVGRVVRFDRSAQAGAVEPPPGTSTRGLSVP